MAEGDGVETLKEKPASSEVQRLLAVNVDRVVAADGFVVISGWAIGAVSLSFENSSGDIDTQFQTTFFPRPDVAEGFQVGPDDARGFLSVCKAEFLADLRVCVSNGANRTHSNVRVVAENSVAETQSLILENVARAGFLLRNVSDSRFWTKSIRERLPRMPGDLLKGAAHLEEARGIPGVGGLVVGWCIRRPEIKTILISESGAIHSLDRAVRWNRDDVVAAYPGYGAFAIGAGLLQRCPEVVIGRQVSIVMLYEDSAFEAASCTWTWGSVDPVSFARWAFDLPIPLERFNQRLAEHDGPIIEALLATSVEMRPSFNPEHRSYGTSVKDPKIAMVIPLFRRFDFIWNQMLAFSEDAFLKENAELVYVVDDPALVDSVIASAPTIYDQFGVPFKVVWSGSNRGFAGATNYGVHASTADDLLLLNSDVIPIESGWLEAMHHALQAKPTVGIVGTTLLFPNGSVQHDGMEFEWEPAWNAFLNKHPGAGLELRAFRQDAITRPLMVTAACMMISRKLYEAVKGLDECFLIGDFEDSDICLKVKEQGKDIVCVSTDRLIHLERQSFSAIGSGTFRDKVARFNAFRHQQRWGAYINKLVR